MKSLHISLQKNLHSHSVISSLKIPRWLHQERRNSVQSTLRHLLFRNLMTYNLKISLKLGILKRKSVKITSPHNRISIFIIYGYSVTLMPSRTLHQKLKPKKTHHSSLPMQSNTKIFTMLWNKQDFSKTAPNRTLKMLLSKN